MIQTYFSGKVKIFGDTFIDSLWSNDDIYRCSSGSALVQIMACSWTNVDFLIVRLCGIHLWVISVCPSYYFCKMSLKICTVLNYQSGTKPNLVAKILAAKFGILFVIYVIFQKYVQCASNNNVIKYCGWGIPHHWNMSFGNFGGLPTLVAFPESQLARHKQINCLSMSASEFTEVPRTTGCKISQGIVG